jgi:ankyrin repeat protein
MVDLLIRAGAQVNAVNRYGMSPLALAAASGSAEIVASLLNAGADLRMTEPALPDGFVPPKVSADGLFVALVRHAVDREAWSQEGASLELKNGILIASAPPPTLDRVQAFVDGVRRLAGVPSR